MKKFLFVALLLISVSGFAQRFQPGVKGGMNISNFVGDNYEDSKYEARIGYNVGAFVGFYFGNHFSLQPEALFSTQGTGIKDLSTGEKHDFNLNYLTIPVMAKFEFNGGFYLETGPEAGINVSSAQFENQKVKDITKNSDFAWGFGLGYHAPFGLGIGARYNVGLSKVADSNFENPDYMNSVAQIGLFYTFFNNHMHR